MKKTFMSTTTNTITFIGKINSSLKTLEDCPLQESENAPDASITIFPEFIAGIKDLKPNSEVLLLTWLHEADRSVIECIPRRNYGAPKIGVFSTRSPDRPNPIGIHQVTVTSIADGLIKISNLEVLDQTPLIDIKPVIGKRN
jgi:tRNA-Thr(GGU) m(6)t(6)A37 methyltransferase TsaA